MKKHADPVQPIWITGVNPAGEALRAETVAVHEMILARSDQRTIELMELADARGIPLRHETRDSLTARVGHGHHQGVALRVEEYAYFPIYSLLERPMLEREPLIVLDCIQDPQNLGALIRSACFLGVKGIVIPKDRSARITGTVIKVAAGGTSYVPVVQVTNLARTIEQIKEAGLWITGLDVQASTSIYEADLTAPLALVLGNEQKGLRPLTRKLCDILVRIPAYGPLQSLNAATAGAIAFAEVQRQRSAKSKQT
ncbi:MAG: 23S rRNA (guanosine(2251)-2'-O)-methyltransferase RlmB [Syntrophobacteraceae bacterium]